MNVLEAIEKMKEGYKITKANNGWYECYAFYDEDYDKFYLYDEENNSDSPLTVYEFTDLDSHDNAEDLLDLDYEIYESEDDKLIRKGKLLDIAIFCDNFSFMNNNCEESCPLRMFCPQVGNVKRMIMGNEKIKNSDIEAMYKAIKEHRGV